MNRLVALICLFLPFAATAQSYTEMSFSTGNGTVADALEQEAAYSLCVKNILRPADHLYLSFGVGASRFIFTPTLHGFELETEKLLVGHIPLGIGYTAGKDNTILTAGADVLPSYYFMNLGRKFVLGFSPNIVLAFKLANGFRMGVIAKAIFMQSAFKEDQGFNAGYVGGGVVFHGW